ncbi:MAG: efflux RND transporter periplasmic adaptor subunit [Acidobacteriota bacterium]
MEEQNKQLETRKSDDSEFSESEEQRLNEDGFDEENEADSSEDEDFDESDEESEDDSESHTTRNVVIGVVIFALIGLAVWYFFLRGGNSKDTAATNEADVVVSVKTETVKTDTISADATAVGTISPLDQAVVSSNVNGLITEMPLWKNQLVTKGQVVARIDTRDLQAQRAEAVSALRESELNLQTLKKSTIPAAEAQNKKDLQDAKAAVDNAQALVDRRKFLYEKGGIALKDLQDAELTLANARNSLQLAEKSVSLRQSAISPLDTQTSQVKISQAQNRIKTLDAQISLGTIRAPLTGFVIDQFQFQGEYATNGGKLLTITDISQVVVKANFSDTLVPDIKVGDAVSVFPADLPNEQMGGKVSLISRSTDPQNRSVEIWVNLQNGAGRLRINSAAELHIATKTQNNALVVPIAAVTLDASNENTGTVMTVDKDNVAHETKVTVGLKTKDEIQITDGLQEGDKIVVEGNYNLPDGTKVEEKPNENMPDAPTSKPDTNSNSGGG